MCKILLFFIKVGGGTLGTVDLLCLPQADMFSETKRFSVLSRQQNPSLRSEGTPVKLFSAIVAVTRVDSNLQIHVSDSSVRFIFIFSCLTALSKGEGVDPLGR